MASANQTEVIDLAEYSAQGKAPPKENRYRLLLDKRPYVSDLGQLTGAEILALGQLDPAQFDLFQAMRGGQRIPIPASHTVDLTEPGIERFFTMKNEHSNGYENARREFELPPDDIAYLASTGLAWDAFVEGNQRWLIIRDRPVPGGFCTNHASVALRIDQNYPMAQIDMAYFRPALSQSAGRDIPSLTVIQIEGNQWQQWSRHRPPNAWRPGIDSLETHLAYVDHFLAAAVRTV